MADQTKEVKKHQTNTEKTDDNGSNLSSKDQTKKRSPELNPSNEHSVNLRLHLQLAGRLPPQIGETRISPLILPPASTMSTPLIQDQHLNSQLPPSLRSCPFANIQTSALLESLLLSQPEALVNHTDVPAFQSPGIATCLKDLIQSLSNSAECAMTGPNQPIPFISNGLPHEIVQPTSTPIISLIPPATLLVPYPFVVPLPVPLPIPIPIPILMSLDSKTFIKTGSTVDKSTQTSSTIPCCTSSMAYPIFPVSQDKVLDLSLKATQTKREHVLSPSPDSALDLSVVNSNSRFRNGRNAWTLHEGNGNNITRSKYEDYNGKIVRPTQTVKVIVSPTETVPAPLCDKRRGFSWDYMKADGSQDNGVQDNSKRLSTTHPHCSEPQRRILNNKNVHFKRDGSHMYGDTPPFKKLHLAYFLPENS
ncbi:retinoic acid-induced protein 2 [Labeo rohita]|uniref:retinoic acid-induced protein 2 n=1 Tax=Labeo rohita TaxID=84645 RepID=UPI0021E20015|nr:retinoic acid-induced protein 2 [Labeo rohita]